MNISFDFDGDDHILDILDGIFLAMLREELKTELSSYGEDKIFKGNETHVRIGMLP